MILCVFGRVGGSRCVKVLWAVWPSGCVAKRGQPLLVNLVGWCLEAIHITDVSCACRGSCKITNLDPQPYKDTMHKQNQKILKRTRKKNLFSETGNKNTGSSQPVQFSRVPRCPTLVPRSCVHGVGGGGEGSQTRRYSRYSRSDERGSSSAKLSDGRRR